MSNSTKARGSRGLSGFARAMLPILLILGIPLVVLVLSGLGEVLRKTPELHRDRIRSEARIVEKQLSDGLLAGLPMNKISGFDQMIEPVTRSNPWLESIEVLNREGATVRSWRAEAQPPAQNAKIASICVDDFIAEATSELNSSAPTGVEAGASHTAIESRASELRSAALVDVVGEDLVVALPLESKAETVGCLVLSARAEMVWETASHHFSRILLAAFVALVVLVMGLLVAYRWWPHRWQLLVEAGFTLVYLTLSVFVAWSLVEVYGEIIHGKSEALAASLAQRLSAPSEHGISFDDLEGISETLDNYREANPDIESIVLLDDDGRARFHTDRNQVDTRWTSQASSNYESTRSVATVERHGAQAQMQLVLSIPRKVIQGHIIHGFKNFLALFIASFILSRLFLRVGTSMGTSSRADQNSEGAPVEGPPPQEVGDHRFDLIRSLFTVIALMEGLVASFLPIYFETKIGGAGGESVDALFSLYFAAFTAVLIPSGSYAQKHGAKSLIVVGLSLSIFGLLGLVFADSFTGLAAARILSGCGQGVAFIGVQSHLLHVGKEFGQSARAASVIVIGYQCGAISGLAIGALLESSVGASPVFITAAACGLLGLWFLHRFIDDVRPEPSTVSEPVTAAKRDAGFVATLRLGLRDIQFLGTTMLVGMPTKALFTGVVMFMWPLLLNETFEQEDIGQILMLYGAGVLLSNRLMPGLAERFEQARSLLVIGMFASVFSLLAMAAVGLSLSNSTSSLVPFALAATATGAFGLAQGFIHAPVLNHIASTRTSATVGRASGSSFYRFLERIGHIGGPIAVGLFMAHAGKSTLSLAWLAALVAVLALLFWLLPDGRKRSGDGQS